MQLQIQLLDDDSAKKLAYIQNRLIKILAKLLNKLLNNTITKFTPLIKRHWKYLRKLVWLDVLIVILTCLFELRIIWLFKEQCPGLAP